MIRLDPRRAAHTAVAISAAEGRLGELRVRASAVQAERLPAWAADAHFALHGNQGALDTARQVMRRRLGVTGS